ncbi:MAG: CHASE2 domain-containing protein [Bacteroidales bacterium]|nr:CHASE2 domain-containing protein [Bacteroidales bacterium]
MEKKPNWKSSRLIFESFFATLLVFAIIWLLELVVINLSFFDPFEKAFGDFQYTDVLYSRIGRAQTNPDTNIVLLSIDDLTRGEIANLLGDLNSYSPAVVGIDILFTERKDPGTDSLLKVRLQETHNLVMPGYLTEDVQGKLTGYIKSNPFFGNLPTGHVNFIASDPERSTVRSFDPELIFHGDTIPSFSWVLLRMCDPVRFTKSRNQIPDQCIIHYQGNADQFIQISGRKALEHPSLLGIARSKIVLMGSFYPTESPVQSIEDKYFTPLNSQISGRSLPDMYGVVIHANILSMMLHGNYIRTVPRILELIISYFLCMMLILFFLYLFRSNHTWYPPVTKLTQLIYVIILLFLVLWFYHTLRIKFDPLLLFLGIVLSAELIYFYDLLVKLLQKWFGIRSYLTSPDP